MVDVFEEIFVVFLVLGAFVGVVVISYTLYNAYTYRDGPNRKGGDDDPLRVGELPTGGGGGKKLFISFTLSAIVVILLIVWTYSMLLYVEAGPPDDADALNVRVEGYQFGWDFVYPNGHTTTGELRIPRDRMITLSVTSRDVFHNFGIPEYKTKTDAIPGQTNDIWFAADDTGTYRANCYELCGAGHSFMTADVVVMEPDAFRDWYADTTTNDTTAANADGTSAAGAPAISATRATGAA